MRKSHKNKNAHITEITKKEAGTGSVGWNIQNPTEAIKVTATEIKFCLDFIKSFNWKTILSLVLKYFTTIGKLFQYTRKKKS